MLARQSVRSITRNWTAARSSKTAFSHFFGVFKLKTRQAPMPTMRYVPQKMGLSSVVSRPSYQKTKEERDSGKTPKYSISP